MLLGSIPVVDEEGYRANVGIIVVNHKRRLLWAKRIGQDAWQFPQGGIHDNETPEQALYRELYEELGLRPEHVELLGCTRGWLRYRLPKHLIRYHSKPLCIGQKQKWFLLRMVGGVDKINFDVTSSPEFDGWRWVSYWFPLRQVISFKRQVYRRALQELAPLVFTEPRVKPDRQPDQGQG